MNHRHLSMTVATGLCRYSGGGGGAVFSWLAEEEGLVGLPSIRPTVQSVAHSMLAMAL